MKYRAWLRVQDSELRNFDEKAYRRETLAGWDAKWHGLSAQARYFFLNDVKGPVKDPVHPNPPTVSADMFPPRILTELSAAGFVEMQPATAGAFSKRVVAPHAVYDFATRVRSLRRLHLLAADQPSAATRISVAQSPRLTWLRARMSPARS
jgi:hypothetical protein